MPTMLYRDFGLVKGVSFDSWRIVGSVMQMVKVYNVRRVDELIFLNINATRTGTSPDFELIDEMADECFMPLTVGGGIKSIEDIKELLQIGADKVSINTSAVCNPDLVKKASKKFGSQCIVISIDAKKCAPGGYEVYTHSGTKPTGRDPFSLALEMESLGAGEILLTSIDRDGTMKGYDIDLIRRVAEGVSIPVIASGGAGNYEDFFAGLTEGKASAVAASSMFYFTEQTPIEAKEFLHSKGISVRL